ncbi:MAG: ATP-binding protein [Salegentibacter sp.]
MKKAFLNWSSGKDAAFALYKLRQDNEYSVEKLVTTLSTDLNRISMHGLRKELLLQQAENIGIPLHIIELGGEVSMLKYNEVMAAECQKLLKEGFTYSVFGDIFLEDLRDYREQQLAGIGLKGVFPLWKLDTSRLMQDFLNAGFKAIVVCTNSKMLDNSFCGRIIDEQFLKDLPENVDPCGENGEFHTFVFDGPLFSGPVKFKIGEKVERSYAPSQDDKEDCFKDDRENWDTRFCYCDLLPA